MEVYAEHLFEEMEAYQVIEQAPEWLRPYVTLDTEGMHEILGLSCILSRSLMVGLGVLISGFEASHPIAIDAVSSKRLHISHFSRMNNGVVALTGAATCEPTRDRIPYGILRPFNLVDNRLLSGGYAYGVATAVLLPDREARNVGELLDQQGVAQLLEPLLVQALVHVPLRGSAVIGRHGRTVTPGLWLSGH